MNRPSSLTAAVVLQWISAIAGIWAGAMLMLGSLAMFNADARAQVEQLLKDAGVTGIEGSMVGIAFFLFALLLVAISVIRLIIAIALGRGRSWARVVITVLSALSLAAAVGQLFGGEWLTGAISIAVEVVILWLMWNASSSAFIKAKTAEHAAKG